VIDLDRLWERRMARLVQDERVRLLAFGHVVAINPDHRDAALAWCDENVGVGGWSHESLRNVHFSFKDGGQAAVFWLHFG
jgi:hypothetical protein